jgi:hypothetical protein
MTYKHDQSNANNPMQTIQHDQSMTASLNSKLEHMEQEGERKVAELINLRRCAHVHQRRIP